MLEHITRSLPVILTQDEFDARAAHLASSIVELDSVDSEIEAVKEARKSQLAGLAEKRERQMKEVRRLTRIVEKRAEDRDVECEQRIDLERKLIEIVRLDTGEVVDTRGMTPFDMQQILDFTDQIES